MARKEPPVAKPGKLRLQRLLQSLESLDTLPEDSGHEFVSELAGFGAAAVESLTSGTRQLSHTGWHLSHEVVGSVTGPLAIPLLFRLITEPEVDLLTANAAKTALLGIGAPSLPALLALEHSSHGLPLHVCAIVAGVNDPRCIPRLVIPMLSDSEAAVRQRAAIGLMKNGRPTSLSALAVCLRDPSRLVRQAARNAIGAIRSTRDNA